MSLPSIFSRLPKRRSPRSPRAFPPRTAAEFSEPASLESLLLDWCEDVAGSSVLHLGCGRGDLARGLVERGAREIHGIDHDRSQVALARRSTPEWSNQSFRVGDLSQPMDLLQDEYDLAVVTISPCEDQMACVVSALKHARRGLRGGGTLFLCIRLTQDGLGDQAQWRQLTETLRVRGFRNLPEVREWHPGGDEFPTRVLRVVG